MFAEAKPLGERGLRWLKIHLANLSGYDKASFDERESFAMEHLDDVFDSADHPLDVSAKGFLSFVRKSLLTDDSLSTSGQTMVVESRRPMAVFGDLLRTRGSSPVTEPTRI